MAKRVEMSIQMVKQVKGGVKWPQYNLVLYHTNCGGKIKDGRCCRCGCSENLERYLAPDNGTDGN